MVQGPANSVLKAAEVLAAAVVRYKYLCEGACFGSPCFLEACTRFAAPPSSSHLRCQLYAGKWHCFQHTELHCHFTALECVIAVSIGDGTDYLIHPAHIVPCGTACTCPTCERQLRTGQQVSREQAVCGVTFVYNAPPKRKVPLAASLASTPLASGCSTTLPLPALRSILDGIRSPNLSLNIASALVALRSVRPNASPVP